uniref:STE20-related kinase adapter protein alpha n=1 Tax=Phallusia mammillata TaxID=59560 RepID=A0A6F9DTA1_9ASCI|nr:STE20-related kinase adapter protein alpha [Phallusia mammillata]
MTNNLTISEFNLIQVVGRSCFSPTSVYLSKRRKSSKLCAIRATDLESCSLLSLAYIQHELVVSRSFCHPNVLIHENAFVDCRNLYVVTEMMTFGSCSDLIEAHFKYGLDETVISHILKGILKALQYIHQLGFIHRNVKASHILLSDNGVVKLCGHRNVITFLSKEYRIQKVYDFPKHDSMLLPWLSPEVLKQDMEGYTSQSDIYSLGITACELANGHAPFTDMPCTQMLLEKLNGTVPCLLDETTVPPTEDPSSPENNEQQMVSRSRKFSPNFHKFVFSCLQFQPSSRPTASEALCDLFIEQTILTPIDLAEKLKPLVPITSFNPDKDLLPSIDIKVLEDKIASVNLTDVSWDFDVTG